MPRNDLISKSNYWMGLLRPISLETMNNWNLCSCLININTGTLCTWHQGALFSCLLTYVPLISEIKATNVQSHCSTLHSSTVSSADTESFCLHCWLFAPHRCPVFTLHTAGLCVSDKHWYDVTHIRSNTEAGIWVRVYTQRMSYFS